MRFRCVVIVAIRSIANELTTGRLMATFGMSAIHTIRKTYADDISAHQKFLHFHGQNGARLNRDQTVHGSPYQPSWFIKKFGPVFFYAPEMHLDVLVNIWVDEIVCHVHWNGFLDKITSEWREFALYARDTFLANGRKSLLNLTHT
jgi:hypothetical protein